MHRIFNTALRSAKPVGAVMVRNSQRSYTRASKFLRISDEVQDALQSGKPVVSLETTIYTHGFPFPQNIELSEHLESVARENGAVPATIGVLNGKAIVGMSSQEVTELLEKASKDFQTVKLSRRDIGWICGQGLLGREVNGGTTIAGTLVLSQLAGIKVFATGGLGGVHKGGESSMDVSADLTELGRTPVALVTSGCKSFLDIPRTLEYLETQGVGVGTFADGRPGPVDFPAFWTRNSGTSSPRTILDEKEAAAIIHAQFDLPLSSGLLFANPIAEQYSLSKEYMDQVMDQAVQDAVDAGITGPENTPFVLDRIRDITKSETLRANHELVTGNVVRGSRVACELAKLDSKASPPSFWPTAKADEEQKHTEKTNEPIELVVAGCIALDISGDYTGARSSITPHTSNPGRFSEDIGGVGRNIARAAFDAGASLRFCSVVGDDSAGRHLLQAVRNAGMSSDYIQTLPGASSGRYVALNDGRKDLFVAMADMSVIESKKGRLDENWIRMLRDLRPQWLALDANWDAATLQTWIAEAKQLGIRIGFEPVSQEKATRLFQGVSAVKSNKPEYTIDLATPNADELRAMKRALSVEDAEGLWRVSPEGLTVDDMSRLLEMPDTDPKQRFTASMIADALKVTAKVDNLLVTLGKDGVLLVKKLDGLVSAHASIQDSANPLVDGLTFTNGTRTAFVQRFAVPATIDQRNIVSVNGVGDTFFGVILAGLARGRQLDEGMIRIAQRAAAMTLQSKESVSPTVASLASEIGLSLRSNDREV